MAHAMKIKASRAGGFLNHCGREDGYVPTEDEKSKINPERTSKNRVLRLLKSGNFRMCKSDQMAAARKACDTRLKQAIKRHEETTGKALRKDAVGFVDWAVTAPKDLAPQQTGDFFREVMNFMHGRYGNNVTTGFLHLDESTPHIHVPVLPLGEDGKLRAKNIINRKELLAFHKDLQKHMDAAGIKCSIELTPEDKVGKALSKVPHDDLEAVAASFEQREKNATELEMRALKKHKDASQKDAEASQRLAEAEKVYQDAQETLRASQSVLEALEGIKQEDDDYFAKREAKIRKQQEKQRENARRVHKASSMLSHNVSRRTRQHSGHSLG